MLGGILDPIVIANLHRQADTICHRDRVLHCVSVHTYSVLSDP